MKRHNTPFVERIEQVKQYYADNGHGWIPARYDTEPRTRLGFWANEIRYRAKKGTLPTRQQEALEAVHFVFDADHIKPGVRKVSA